MAWPQTIADDGGCGAGVAVFTAQLRAPKGGSGSIAGCLDDTHLSTVFPPHIWGQLTLG